MADLNQLISLLGDISDSDKALVEKAYSFAEKAHTGQKRFSGEPYFNHCFETAKILAEQGMGSVSIAAGLLHDTLEDANIKPEELEKEFQGRVKFGKLDVMANQPLAVAYSILSMPAILIFKSGKLVNQLHGFMPKDKLKEVLSGYGKPDK